MDNVMIYWVYSSQIYNSLSWSIMVQHPYFAHFLQLFYFLPPRHVLFLYSNAAISFLEWPNAAILKRPSNSAMDYQTADSEHALKRPRTFGMSDEVFPCLSYSFILFLHHSLMSCIFCWFWFILLMINILYIYPISFFLMFFFFASEFLMFCGARFQLEVIRMMTVKLLCFWINAMWMLIIEF